MAAICLGLNVQTCHQDILPQYNCNIFNCFVTFNGKSLVEYHENIYFTNNSIIFSVLTFYTDLKLKNISLEWQYSVQGFGESP